ncbi:MAG TPA: hypothetical protein VF690_12300 [Hymenobacter sp.]
MTATAQGAAVKADLVITPDSWDGLLGLFGERLIKAVKGNSEEWAVALTPQNRDFVVAQALADEAHVKFLYFYLIEADKELFTSCDRMACLILDPSFPEYRCIVAEYAALGNIMSQIS